MGVYQKKRNDGTKAWYYDFMHNKVRYRAVGGTTKTQALRTLDKIRGKVLNGEYEIERHIRNPKIEEFAELYLERRKHLRSRRRDRFLVQNILKQFEGKALVQIAPTNIEDYIVQRRVEGAANATINRELACLKRMYNLAIKWGDAKRNPVTDVESLEEPPGRTRFLSAEESQKLIECCPDHLKSIVMTALNTGMRLQEVLGLSWESVHIDNVIDPYIEIIKTKNNKPRFVPLNNDMLELLGDLKRKNASLEYVFIGTRGKRLFSIRTPFKEALARAGILDFRFHDLRHTFASHFIMNGGDPMTLKEILGHSSLKMVERYAHLAAAHKRRQINNINGLFRICHPIATSANVVKMTETVSS